MSFKILKHSNIFFIIGTANLLFLTTIFSPGEFYKNTMALEQTSYNKSNLTIQNSSVPITGNTTISNSTDLKADNLAKMVVKYPDLSKTNQTEVVIQNTSMSAPAPVRHPGQPSHEVVFVLPLRGDGKVWKGTVTFTASKPIEVEILHTYSPIKNPDAIHGQPYHAVLPGNKSIAITHLRNLVDVPIEINGIGISSGTLDFIGNALLFHKTSGEPFTVTYTIYANLKNLTTNQ